MDLAHHRTICCCWCRLYHQTRCLSAARLHNGGRWRPGLLSCDHPASSEAFAPRSEYHYTYIHSYICSMYIPTYPSCTKAQQCSPHFAPHCSLRGPVARCTVPLHPYRCSSALFSVHCSLFTVAFGVANQQLLLTRCPATMPVFNVRQCPSSMWDNVHLYIRNSEANVLP